MSTGRNLKLLRQVKAQILKEPRQFVMGDFFTRRAIYAGSGNDAERVRIPNCGTAACIAGWAVSIATNETPAEAATSGEGTASEAARLLRLSHTEGQALFYLSSWPIEHVDAYIKAHTARGKARVAADRIDHFIKTGE